MGKIKIVQDDYSQGFKATLKSFSDVGIKEFRGNAKEKACWWVNPEVLDADKLKELLGKNFPEETTKFLNCVHTKDISFKELVYTMETDIKTPQEKFEFVGDVYNVSCTKKNGLIIELIDAIDEFDKDNFLQKVKIYWHNRNDEQVDVKDYKDHRVRVTGTLNVYMGSIQITATEIEILGDNLRITQLEKWRKENQEFFTVSQKIEYSDIENIGVITSEGSDGYNDFEKKLYHEDLKNRLQVKYVTISDFNSIANAINEFNTENKCSCICIIRGGGNSYDFLAYSHPKLLKAISDSKIKIITGIGHSNDEPLCQCVAYHTEATPTDVGIYLKRVYDDYKKTQKSQYVQNIQFGESKSKNVEVDENLKDLNSKIETLTIQIKKLNQRLEDKDNRISELEQQLNAKNNKGFFSRLFG